MELTRETLQDAIERMVTEPTRPAVDYINATLAENERLRAFAAEQYDQLLAANAEIERLRLTVRTLEAQAADLRLVARELKLDNKDAWKRLGIVRDALIEAHMIEREWDGSEEEETR